eukprot:TRINITY_DN7149_c0_g1_i7.p1 TRINITY_DN7149_c0_g1~~TRINITY_DN7149_c0_g1_i7.p1  ORF type:complete len:642 (-),score=80.64 TRINITY_DN7149_c0_g1_i7:185-2110(-)
MFTGSDVEDLVLFLASLVSFAAWWNHRGDLPRILRSLAFCRKYVQTAKSKRRSELYKAAIGASFKDALRLGVNGVMLVIACRVCFTLVSGQSLGKEGAYVCISISAAFFVVKDAHTSKVSSALDSIALAVSLAQIWGMHQHPDLASFMMSANPRGAVRIFCALFFIDIRKNIGANTLFAAMSIYKHITLFRQSGVAVTFAAIVFTEIAALVLLVVIVVICQRRAQQLADLQIELGSLKSIADSANNLLSVLCDATVTIAADLSVIDGGRQLASMLMLSTGRQQGIEGRSICDFFQVADAARLRDFVRLGASTDNHNANDQAQRTGGEDMDILQSPPTDDDATETTFQARPPVSMHFDMLDSAGLVCPVEVFQVLVPNVLDPTSKPRHLIGIKEVAAALHAVPDAPGHNLPGVASASVGTGQRVCRAGPQSNAFVHGSASFSPRSRTRIIERPIPEVQSIEFIVNARSDGLVCKELRIRFQISDASSFKPCLGNWMQNSSEFVDWVRTTLNQPTSIGTMCANDMEDVELCFPLLEDQAIRARHVNMSVVESPQDTSQEQSHQSANDNEKNDLNVCITMAGLTRHNRARKGHGMPTQVHQPAVGQLRGRDLGQPRSMKEGSGVRRRETGQASLTSRNLALHSG